STSIISITYEILISVGLSLIYITFGGLLTVIITDFAKFLVQLSAGIIMFVIVITRFGEGSSSILGMWDRLPPENSQLFNEPYTAGFALVFLFIAFLSFNGGSWSLATRYISSTSEKDASKAAQLSGVLYLLWPLVLFFPMWAAPLLLPDLEDPSQSYALLTTRLLPAGLVGLVLAGMFAHTMAMTSSDANAISAVVIRDILPRLWKGARSMSGRVELAAGRFSVFTFIALSMVIALAADSFGGVLGLIVLWFGALVGPIAIPMLLGMLPAFRRCGPSAAVVSWAGGLVVFALVKYVFDDSIAAL